MEFILTLWKPILLAAVIVHFASAIIWMASPLHKHDYKNPGSSEGAILAFLRSAALAPGVYNVPWCTHKDAKDPAHIEKMKAGPWAQINVMPGVPNMGQCMILWIVNLLIVGTFVAYITSHALVPGASYLKVFQIVGATAFLAHAGNAATLSIWMGQPWRQFPGRIVDGLIYALLTAGTFAWLWPKA